MRPSPGPWSASILNTSASPPSSSISFASQSNASALASVSGSRYREPAGATAPSWRSRRQTATLRLEEELATDVEAKPNHRMNGL
jgi:hypothetical protein